MDLCRWPAGTEHGLVPFMDVHCVRLCTVYRRTTAKVHVHKKLKFQSLLSLRWTPVELLVREKNYFPNVLPAKDR